MKLAFILEISLFTSFVLLCYTQNYEYDGKSVDGKGQSKVADGESNKDGKSGGKENAVKDLQKREGKCFTKFNHSAHSTPIDFSWEYFNEECDWWEENVPEEPQIQEDEIEVFREDLCSDDPVVRGNNTINSPGNGFIFVFRDKMFVLEAPKTLKNYPKVIRVNTIPHFALEPTVSRMDALTKIETTWYGAIAFERNAILNESSDEAILDAIHFGFDSLQRRPRFIDVETLKNDMKIYFLLVPQFTNSSEHHRKTKRFLDSLLVTTQDDDYQGLVAEDIYGIPFVKFKMNGNVEIDKNGVEVRDDFNQKIAAIDQFDFDSIAHASLGYRSYGRHYRNFRSTPCKDSGQCLSGQGFFFQNQVLIGCPPNQCHYGSIDAATKIGDKVIIVYDQYWWELPDRDGERRPTFENVRRLKELQAFGIDERIRAPIDDMFLFEDRMHIFKPVFFKEDRLLSISKMTESSLNDSYYMEYQLSDVFPNMNPNVWVGRIDATLLMENRIFIFKGDSYYVYDMKSKTMDSSYLKNFMFDLNLYPRPTADFAGLPEVLDTAYTDGEGTSYFFHGNYVFKSKGRKDMPESRVNVEYLQQNYFSCDGFNFLNTPYKNQATFHAVMLKHRPKEAVDKSTFSIKKVLIWASIVWTVIILVAVGTLIFAQVYDYRLQNRKKLRFQIASLRKGVKELSTPPLN